MVPATVALEKKYSTQSVRAHTLASPVMPVEKQEASPNTHPWPTQYSTFSGPVRVYRAVSTWPSLMK